MADPIGAEICATAVRNNDTVIITHHYFRRWNPYKQCQVVSDLLLPTTNDEFSLPYMTDENKIKELPAPGWSAADALNALSTENKDVVFGPFQSRDGVRAEATPLMKNFFPEYNQTYAWCKECMV